MNCLVTVCLSSELISAVARSGEVQEGWETGLGIGGWLLAM